jgi:hypothetical protein
MAAKTGRRQEAQKNHRDTVGTEEHKEIRFHAEERRKRGRIHYDIT